MVRAFKPINVQWFINLRIGQLFSLAHPATNLTLILLPGNNLRVTMQYSLQQREIPLPILDDLAIDDKFKGKVVIDVTEGLFFSTSPANLIKPINYKSYYKKRTPAQRFSFLINYQLEENRISDNIPALRFSFAKFFNAIFLGKLFIFFLRISVPLMVV